MDCVVCGSPIKAQGAATRILWKLHTCQARACVSVFKMLSSDEQKYIHLDANGEDDCHIKTKSYIAVLEDFVEFYYEGGDEDNQMEFKKNGFSIAELFNAYKTFIEATYKKREYTTSHVKKYCESPEFFKYIQIDISYTIYFKPDFSRIAFLYEQYKKLYKLELNISSLSKAMRNVGQENFGLCRLCNYSIIRTSHFKQFHI